MQRECGGLLALSRVRSGRHVLLIYVTCRSSCLCRKPLPETQKSGWVSVGLSIDISTIFNTTINLSVCSRNSMLSYVVLQNVSVEALSAI